MVYVFTFLGEFGYELLNWQGVIRKFSRTLDPSDAIVCCSRANLYPIYEMADLYIDISEVLLFRSSRACCYSATVGAGAPSRRVNRAFDAALRASLRSFVRRRIAALRPEWATSGRLLFAFSSRKTEVRGFTFGCNPDRLFVESDIFDRLDVEANHYVKIEPDLRLREDIEQRLGFDLSAPYALVQARPSRIGSPQSPVIPKEELIRQLGRRLPVVLLSFKTGRAFDSFSRFDASLRWAHYQARSFPEQACLIAMAKHCVFFTEGELGSHTYVPPLMGRDVVVIAPRAVHELERTAVDLWNRRVFRFGGQLVPKIAEDVCASPHSVKALVDEILGG